MSIDLAWGPGDIEVAPGQVWTAAEIEVVSAGDKPGHAFRGNQYHHWHVTADRQTGESWVEEHTHHQPAGALDHQHHSGPQVTSGPIDDAATARIAHREFRRLTKTKGKGKADGEADEQAGDAPGHPFHGNQWTGGKGAFDASDADAVKAEALSVGAKVQEGVGLVSGRGWILPDGSLIEVRRGVHQEVLYKMPQLAAAYSRTRTVATHDIRDWVQDHGWVQGDPSGLNYALSVTADRRAIKAIERRVESAWLYDRKRDAAHFDISWVGANGERGWAHPRVGKGDFEAAEFDLKAALRKKLLREKVPTSVMHLLRAELEDIERAGDLPGHQFHGNQWTSRIGGYSLTPEQSARVEKYMSTRGMSRAAMVANLDAMYANAGANVTSDAKWFHDAHGELQNIATQYGVPIRRVAATAAALSPQAEWGVNVATTRLVFDQLRKNPKITSDELTALTTTNRDIVKMGIRMARGENPDKVLTGAKRRSFFANLAAPDAYGPVTIDGHMAHVMTGVPKRMWKGLIDHVTTVKGKQLADGYAYMAEVTRERAAAHGLLPQEFQSVVWNTYNRTTRTTRAPAFAPGAKTWEKGPKVKAASLETAALLEAFDPETFNPYDQPDEERGPLSEGTEAQQLADLQAAIALRATWTPEQRSEAVQAWADVGVDGERLWALQEARLEALRSGADEEAGLVDVEVAGDLQRAYSADQARDPHGRWTSKGARAEVEAATAARSLLTSAQEVEPEVTKDMQGLASAHGAELVGLHNRLKSTGSLTRKILLDAQVKGISHDKAAAAISDVLRYTVALPQTSYTDGVKAVLRDLRAKGYQYTDKRVKNFWANHNNYRGINMKMIHASGQGVELQFHTHESLAAKEEIHKLYERARLPGVPARQVAFLNAQMHRVTDALRIPNRVLEIGAAVVIG